jgi:hypothetical protein
MSNGNGTDKRFSDIAGSFATQRLHVDPPEPSPDPEDVTASNLQSWASMREVADTFLPWLNERIDLLDDQEEVSARDHPALLLAKGRRLEAKYVRDMFHQWRGQPHTRPAAKE